MSRKKILQNAKDQLIAAKDRDIAEKISVLKNGLISEHNKKIDELSADASKELTEKYVADSNILKEVYNANVEKLKLAYNTSVKEVEGVAKIQKEKYAREEIEAVTKVTELQYLSDISDLTKKIEAIKE